MKKLVFLFSCLTLFWIASCSLKNTKQDDVAKWIKHSGVTLIDVREAEELEHDGKIDRALHIPKDAIPDHIEEIRKMSNPIVIFCRSGSRAEEVVALLYENQIKEVYNGGGWEEVQEALEK